MSQVIRQRITTATEKMSTDNDDENEPLEPFEQGLDAPRLLQAQPQQNGVVLKLRMPLLFTILPACVQRMITSHERLAFMGPQWSQRYLILIGSFLYKFKNEKSKQPKGSPFSVDRVETKYQSVSSIIADNNYDDELFSSLSKLPPQYQSIITVSTMSKRHYYAVADEEEAKVWIQSLRQARQEMITRNMGHANHVPYPAAWKYIDSLGLSLQKRKDRIKAKLEDYNRKELEMTSMQGSGFLS